MKLKKLAAVLSALCMMMTTANGGVVSAFILLQAQKNLLNLPRKTMRAKKTLKKFRQRLQKNLLMPLWKIVSLMKKV